MKNILLSLFLFTVGLTSCSSEGSSEKQTSDSVAVADITTYPENLEASSFPNGELVHETGLLKKYKDGGYPIVTLTIEFPVRKLEETFTLNLEEVKNIRPEILSKSTGRYLDFEYLSNIENALMDIQNNGKSIFKSDAIPVTKEMKKITGTLKGAGETTAGDLPSEITITDANEKVTNFEYFVTEEMVKFNNKNVTVYHEERPSNNIISLKILK
jgi:hypothetical protein